MTIFDAVVEQWGGRSAVAAALGERRLHGRLEPDVAASLMTWTDVAQVLVGHRLTPPEINLIETTGRRVNPARYVDSTSSPRRQRMPLVDLAAVAEILGTGATLVVNDIDTVLPTIGATAWDLSELVGEHVGTHLYATRGATPAFPPHWDVVDVLVVQVEGAKHWDVYGPGTPNPISPATDPDNVQPPEPEWSGVLRPGDVLYLPRGWWHGVRGTGGTSLHLSYGFQSQTGLAYLAWLTMLAKQAAPFRTDVPHTGADDVEQHAKLLLESLVQLARDHPLAEYLAEHAGGLGRPDRPHLDGVT